MKKRLTRKNQETREGSVAVPYSLQPGGLHDNDGSPESDKDISDSQRAGDHANHVNDENYGNLGCKRCREILGAAPLQKCF